VTLHSANRPHDFAVRNFVDAQTFSHYNEKGVNVSRALCDGQLGEAGGDGAS